jgi:hypothetical protein
VSGTALKLFSSIINLVIDPSPTFPILVLMAENNEIRNMAEYARARYNEVVPVLEAVRESRDRINAYVVSFHADEIGADKVLDRDGNGRSVGTYDEINDTYRAPRLKAAEVAKRLRGSPGVSNVKILHWGVFVEAVADRRKASVEAVEEVLRISEASA